MGLAHKDST